jgi:hypothetical protein
MDSLVAMMLPQFERQQEAYFDLLAEIQDVRAEMAKTAERMDLLRQLLQLDGKEISLPPEVAENLKNRKAA